MCELFWHSGDASALHYRVNSKARPEVYNIVTDVLNNRSVKTLSKWKEACVRRVWGV